MYCTTLIRAMLDAVHAFYIYTNEIYFDCFLISLFEFSKYVQMCNFEVGTSDMQQFGTRRFQERTDKVRFASCQELT